MELLILKKYDNRFRLYAVCSDKKADITIIFPDREVRRITGKNIFEVDLEDTKVVTLTKYQITVIINI